MSGAWRRAICVWAMAAAVAVTACGAAPLVRDDVGRDTWYELATEHIVLTTDLPSEDAAAHVRELEQSWRALTAMYVLIAPWAKPPEGQFPVIHLRSCAAFNEIKPMGWRGFVAPSREFSGERIVVTCEAQIDMRDVFLHELAHILNHHCFPLAPRWVDEGLAQYFETMEMTGGRAVIGKRRASDVYRWQRPGSSPELSQLLALDYSTFYPDRDGRHYFAAWKLVHLLNNTSPDYRNRFRGFLAMLHGDHARKDAWEPRWRGTTPWRARPMQACLWRSRAYKSIRRVRVAGTRWRCCTFRKEMWRARCLLRSAPPTCSPMARSRA